MGKRIQLTAVLLLFVAVGGVVTWRVFHEPEPIYQGKPLTAWVESPRSPDVGPWQAAVRSCGTSAIPVLLRMLRKTDSPLTLKLVALARKVPFAKPDYVPAETWHENAWLGFEALGSSTTNAISALTNIFELKVSPSSQRTVVYILGIIGPRAKQAVPCLISGANGSDRKVAGCSVWALARIHAGHDLVVPLLVKFARPGVDPATGLPYFGLGPSVPDLLQMATDQDTLVREYAQDAMRAIDTEAPAKLGVTKAPKQD